MQICDNTLSLNFYKKFEFKSNRAFISFSTKHICKTKEELERELIKEKKLLNVQFVELMRRHSTYDLINYSICFNKQNLSYECIIHYSFTIFKYLKYNIDLVSKLLLKLPVYKKVKVEFSINITERIRSIINVQLVKVATVEAQKIAQKSKRKLSGVICIQGLQHYPTVLSNCQTVFELSPGLSMNNPIFLPEIQPSKIVVGHSINITWQLE